MDWTSIHWPGGAPLWFIFLVGAALAESLRRRWPHLRERLSLGRTGVLFALRGLLYGLILFFLSGPTLIEKNIKKLPPRLLVLVDGSKSMGVKDMAGGRSRFEAARQVLLGEKEGGPEKRGLLARLSSVYEVKVLRYDTRTTPLPQEVLRHFVPEGSGSDLPGAIEAELRKGGGAAGKWPSMILLLSDGGDTSGAPWLSPGAEKMPPVVSVGLGAPERFRDISLHGVRAPRIAFRGKEIRFEVTLSVKGFTGKKLLVALTREGRVVRTQTLNVRRGASRKTLQFRYTPEEEGGLLLAVETPVLKGEFVRTNNRVEIPIEVRKDKIRVLTISGSPGWNYRFLRMALKRDPIIDLVSFVFLRSSQDDPGVPTEELSLVPFPLDKLFLEELKNFDVIVFDNFSTHEYFSNYYLERVADYVRSGGAFLMLGGSRSYAAGGYANGPLQALLPVQLADRNDYIFRQRVKGRLTETGLRHPITRLAGGPAANKALWDAFPPLRRLNLTGASGEGQVLVSSRDSGVPLLAVRRFGEGRVLAVTSDDFWRWNFGMVGAKKSNNLYLQLISKMMRWLSGDPASSQVRILPEAEPGEKGMRVLRVDVRDDAYRPAANAKVLLLLRGPYGNVRRLPAVFQPETGEFEARFVPGGGGTYRVEAQARIGGQMIGRAVRAVRIGGSRGAEMADVAPRWERLARLSKKTGGAFFPFSGSNRKDVRLLMDEIEKSMRGTVPPQIVEIRDVRLWSVPWMGIWLILLPAAEWTLRRVWGLA